MLKLLQNQLSGSLIGNGNKQGPPISIRKRGLQNKATNFVNSDSIYNIQVVRAYQKEYALK